MATWRGEFKLPWRKAGLLVSMIKWTRTSGLSIKISLSTQLPHVKLWLQGRGGAACLRMGLALFRSE